MAVQPSLFGLPSIISRPMGNLSIEQQFALFHRENPHVYEALRDLALEMRRKGHRHYGVKGLYEVLRWHYAMKTNGDAWKLNNNFTAHYARLLMRQEPELREFFEVRE